MCERVHRQRHVHPHLRRPGDRRRVNIGRRAPSLPAGYDRRRPSRHRPSRATPAPATSPGPRPRRARQRTRVFFKQRDRRRTPRPLVRLPRASRSPRRSRPAPRSSCRASAASGTRADIVYLDTRLMRPQVRRLPDVDRRRARAAATSRSRRSRATPRSTARSLGERTHAASFGAPTTTGVVVALLPRRQRRARHRLRGRARTRHDVADASAPSAEAADDRQEHRRSTSRAGLNWTDPDGDPVTFTVDDPRTAASPAVSTPPTRRTPAQTRVGSASPTPRVAGSISASHAITITNQQPMFDAPAPAIVDEGGAPSPCRCTPRIPTHSTRSCTASSPARPAADHVAGAPRSSAPRCASRSRPASAPMGPLQSSCAPATPPPAPAPPYADQDLSVTIRPDLRRPRRCCRCRTSTSPASARR